MDKEREIKFESGFSEKELDLAVDKQKANDQTRGGNIFDPQKKKKKSESTIDPNTQ